MCSLQHDVELEEKNCPPFQEQSIKGCYAHIALPKDVFIYAQVQKI